MTTPDYEAVADVLIRIALRLVQKGGGKPEDKEGARAHNWLLQGLDRGASLRGVLNRGPGGQAPGLCGAT